MIKKSKSEFVASKEAQDVLASIWDKAPNSGKPAVSQLLFLNGAKWEALRGSSEELQKRFRGRES